MKCLVQNTNKQEKSVGPVQGSVLQDVLFVWKHVERGLRDVSHFVKKVKAQRQLVVDRLAKPPGQRAKHSVDELIILSSQGRFPNIELPIGKCFPGKPDCRVRLLSLTVKCITGRNSK
jgi:hypothetical protein